MILSLIYLFLLVDLASKLYIYIILHVVCYIHFISRFATLSIYTLKSIIYIFLHAPVTRSRALSWRDSLLLVACAAKLSLDIIYLFKFICAYY